MTKRVRVIGARAKAVRSTSRAAGRVETRDVADAFKSVPTDFDTEWSITPPAMLALRRALSMSLRSKGGRPGLEGAERRQKIPMIDEDWLALERVASSLRATGLNTTAGQVAGQLLRDAISRLGTSSTAYPVGPHPAPLRISEAVAHTTKRPAADAPASKMRMTYLVGAGINQGAIESGECQLPLARDFFRYVLTEQRLSARKSSSLEPLLKFIETYWHKDENALRTTDFDLEACFTMLELQRREAERDGDEARWRSVAETESCLGWLLHECFGSMGGPRFPSPLHQRLGKRIYDDGASVLTFNYDTLLEDAITLSSPLEVDKLVRPFGADDEGPDAYSRHAWKPLLAYKVRFDDLVVRPGPPAPESGEAYYASFQEVAAEHPPFLKLHGSVDWFYRSPFSIFKKTIVQNDRSIHTRFWRTFLPLDGEQGEWFFPILITPVLHKAVLEPFFRQLWERARNVLRTTKTLVIAGYSFPPTDFHVQRLLREAFAENELEQLCVVNPDTSVVAVARDFCNFRRPVLVCRDIQEYLEKMQSEP